MSTVAINEEPFFYDLNNMVLGAEEFTAYPDSLGMILRNVKDTIRVDPKTFHDVLDSAGMDWRKIKRLKLKSSLGGIESVPSKVAVIDRFYRGVIEAAEYPDKERLQPIFAERIGHYTDYLAAQDKANWELYVSGAPGFDTSTHPNARFFERVAHPPVETIARNGWALEQQAKAFGDDFIRAQLEARLPRVFNGNHRIGILDLDPEHYQTLRKHYPESILRQANPALVAKLFPEAAAEALKVENLNHAVEAPAKAESPVSKGKAKVGKRAVATAKEAAAAAGLKPSESIIAQFTGKPMDPKLLEELEAEGLPLDGAIPQSAPKNQASLQPPVDTKPPKPKKPSARSERPPANKGVSGIEPEVRLGAAKRNVELPKLPSSAPRTPKPGAAAPGGMVVTEAEKTETLWAKFVKKPMTTRVAIVGGTVAVGGIVGLAAWNILRDREGDAALATSAR